MEIRPVTKADASEFYDLMREFYFDFSPRIVTGRLADFDAWAEGIAETEILVSSLTDESLVTLVAEEDGRLIGYITGTIKDYPRKKLNKEGYIWDLYVADGRRGRGTGRALIEAMANDFERQGCTHLGLEAFVTNPGAIELYKRLGFIEYDVVMKRRLGK